MRCGYSQFPSKAGEMSNFESDKRDRIEIGWLLTFTVMFGLIGVGVLMFFVGLLIGGMVR